MVNNFFKRYPAFHVQSYIYKIYAIMCYYNPRGNISKCAHTRAHKYLCPQILCGYSHFNKREQFHQIKRKYLLCVCRNIY